MEGQIRRVADAMAVAKTLKVYDGTISVNVTVDATDVGTGQAFVVSAGILRGFLIIGNAPGGTAGGAKTINYAVGSVVNANNTLSGTDVDIMIAAGSKTAASVHGDAALDHAAAYFTTDYHGVYLSVPTTMYLNYIGKAASATGTPGTVTCLFKLYAFMQPLG